MLRHIPADRVVLYTEWEEPVRAALCHKIIIISIIIMPYAITSPAPCDAVQTLGMQVACLQLLYCPFARPERLPSACTAQPQFSQHCVGRWAAQSEAPAGSRQQSHTYTVKMEATCYVETVDFHRTARSYIPEDRTLQFSLVLKP
jgi:hypothetical protein